HFSRGIPRLVNVVCDNALVIGYALGKKRIGADLITEAAADLLVEPAVEDAPGRPAAVLESQPAATRAPSRWRARFGVIGLVLVAMIVGLFSVGRTMLRKRGDDEGASAAAPQMYEVIRPGTQPQTTGVDIPVGAEGEGLAAPRAAADDDESNRPTAQREPF